MNDLGYLNQIAAANRPLKQGFSLQSFMRSKIFKLIVGALVALILIIGIGSLVGSIAGKEKDLLTRLNVRITALNVTIGEYNDQVKSSSLRGMGASLMSTLSETGSNLYTVLVADYDYSVETVKTDITDEEAEQAEAMKLALSNAKLNGLLDRVYRQQLIYQTSLLISMESEAMERTGNDAVRGIMTKSVASLSVLLQQLENYSDSTN